MDNNSSILTMPFGDIKQGLKEVLAEAMFTPEQEEAGRVKKHYAYGLAGVMQTFGCSKSTAFRLVHSGVLDPALSRVRRLIVLDVDFALDLFRVSKAPRRRK